MFKKLKDKLAEEVKSSPQRIQQFAQAAQAAVTSASSSISDITNSDLFSIGDNESQSSQTVKPSTSAGQVNAFQEVPLVQSGGHNSSDSMSYAINHEDNQRQRRLSNSSFTSDISFRLPSYESPSMYHLQSDMEVSASEAEERGFSSGAVSLDRVTKEQLYAAYRRTQERYTKYRTQYADLARHYKLLERENAKAKSVLVETQDKALRRISELREQCSLEQSAKAHLEKALRVDIEERNMKIEALSTKISLLQNINESNTHSGENIQEPLADAKKKYENDVQLINLSSDNEDKKLPINEVSTNEQVNLTNKIEKMEQLLNKYKESLKSSKEKNSQLEVELKKLSTELDTQMKDNDKLKSIEAQLVEAQQKILELNMVNEELHNKVNTYDFGKTKELSTLEMDLQKSKEEIMQLRGKIDIFSKREEEYAISLAENKLSIHKELESKEAEIKSLKDNLSAIKNELQSVNIIVNDYKNNVSTLEEERSKLKNEINELNMNKARINEMESQILVLTQKCQSLEQLKVKLGEEMKCLQLQMKQETAEKLAMIDRNDYLENRNALLIEENTKKSSQISSLEQELISFKKETSNISSFDESTKQQLIEEIEFWKAKFNNLESEIQEERVELVKLQSEIEKLIRNHELIQSQNEELHGILESLKIENSSLRQKVSQNKNVIMVCQSMAEKVKHLQKNIKLISTEARTFKKYIVDEIPELRNNIATLGLLSQDYVALKTKYDMLEDQYQILQKDTKSISENLSHCTKELNIVKANNETLNSQIELSTTEKTALRKESQGLNDKYDAALQELTSIKNDKQMLITRLEEVENKCLHLQTAVDEDNNQYLEALDKLKVIQDEKQTLLKKFDKIEKENELLNTEIEKLKIKHKDDISHIEKIYSEKDKLIRLVEDKDNHIENLNKKGAALSQENTTLKKQCESIANSVKKLEEELNEVRKSHSEMEGEKDRLNSVIEILEKKEQAKELTNKALQTEINLQTNAAASMSKDNDEIIYLLKNIDELNIKHSRYEEDITNLKETITQLTNSNVEATEDNLLKVNSITAKYNELQNDYDRIKEENRRLQSDVEGLQTYLGKVSKENGVLNDKLRELIASSENTYRGDYQSTELLELQNEVLADKEKIDDLTRENILLVEENLELKDQLQSQNYADMKKSTNNNDNDAVSTEKYNNLQETKNELEEKVMALEQMNRSINGNMQQIQGSNEKLKLTNEKLERRLDEALVSLRHLHSLQENTELEYLKNILYEYLTGSGTHSVTLAKVLAAVVKFDDKQTQHVLQKEKERQGILRQLGLL